MGCGVVNVGSINDIGNVGIVVVGDDTFGDGVTGLDCVGATRFEVVVFLIGFAVVLEACSVVFVFWSVEIDAEVAVCLIGFAVVLEACSVVFVFWSVEIDVEVSTSTP